MSAATTIQLDAMHAAKVERVGRSVKLSFVVGSITMASKTIPAAKARALGDALGFLANDIELPAVNPGLEARLRVGEEPPACAVRPDSTWPRNCGTCELRLVAPGMLPPCGNVGCDEGRAERE